MADTAEITELRAVDARLEPARWAFAEDRRDDIAAHWAGLVAEKPRMFNGTVLMQHDWMLANGVYSARYSAVDYASFIAWIRMGQPGARRRNGFAMAALQGSDGAFLLGVMGAHTANAGKIYFPAGTPDMNDVTADGKVDLAGSLERELLEETGLKRDEVEIDDRWVLVTESYRAAFMKPTRLKYTSEMARRIMLERLEAETDQELADYVIVRKPSDIDEARTPDFAKAYMLAVFSGQIEM